MDNHPRSQRRLLVFAPTRRAASETFVRANLAGLPFELDAYFGDEFPWRQPLRCAYGIGCGYGLLCHLYLPCCVS